jgi:hypothetical protein
MKQRDKMGANSVSFIHESLPPTTNFSTPVGHLTLDGHFCTSYWVFTRYRIFCELGLDSLNMNYPGVRKRNSDVMSPSLKKSRNPTSGSTSSLSPPSLASPIAGPSNPPDVIGSPLSDNSSEPHQPEPAPAIHQYQVFGPDPLKFDDPTIYHIREVTPGMTDEEKNAIYCVAQFPRGDLSHMMAGTPPDKDFSNAKPTNQASANSFTSYIEPYVRPLTEEDIAFLKEKVSCRFLHLLITLTLSRVIALLHSLYRDAERHITLRYGRKRMAC